MRSCWWLAFAWAAGAWAQPVPPARASRWDVWTVGSKGGYAGTPECHTRDSFPAPPPRFDYEGDFFGMKPIPNAG